MSRRPSRRPARRHTALLAAALLGGVPLLAACTENADPAVGGEENPRAVNVVASDEGCEVSTTDVPAGTLTFTVTNTGSQVNEFYLLADDGLRIIGEVENIGENASRTLTVNATEGSYVTACKPGMVGQGIRSDFAVSASDDTPELSASDQELVDQALASYQAYVEDQSAQLLAATEEFVGLYESGDDDAARALYPEARMHWERIETVAESFGDLDPKMDAREADLAPDERWTGWHRIEKDLWPEDAEAGYTALTDAERTEYADDLLANTEELDGRVQELTYTIDDLANGSRGLLEEVATGKVTGEEEIWSHTDLWDFQANVEGARIAYEGVQEIVEGNDPDLAEELTTEFEDLQVLLDSHREGDGFVLYTDLTEDEVGELADAVNALSEPLGRLTASVV